VERTLERLDVHLGAPGGRRERLELRKQERIGGRVIQPLEQDRERTGTASELDEQLDLGPAFPGRDVASARAAQLGTRGRLGLGTQLLALDQGQPLARREKMRG